MNKIKNLIKGAAGKAYIIEFSFGERFWRVGGGRYFSVGIINPLRSISLFYLSTDYCGEICLTICNIEFYIDMRN
ncbi:MAG: hypothetical protein FWH53_00710 [Leptospirales bacterium]|nr:hypothetical protein [Leptospirales bacterium]